MNTGVTAIQSLITAEVVPRAQEKVNRNIGLDVVRGIAVLLVFGHHNYIVPGYGGELSRLYNFMHDIGWIGVDLFFVLSGFLIGGLLLKEIARTDRLDVGRFLVRRAFKIWPAYFAFLLITLMASLWHSGYQSFISDYWPNLIHCQNYYPTKLVHTWTLAVEEHFYILLPLLLVLCHSIAKKWCAPERSHVPLLIACITGLIVGNALRFHAVYGLESSAPDFAERLDHVYRQTHFRFDSLLFGCLIACIAQSMPKLYTRLYQYRFSITIVALIVMVAPATQGFTPVVTRLYLYTMLYVAFGGLILLADVSGRTASTSTWYQSRMAQGLAWLGTLSYTFYLWHYHPLITDSAAWMTKAIRPYLVEMPWGLTLVWLAGTIYYFLLSLLAAVLTTKLIEQPFLALRTRLCPSSRTVQPTPSAS